MSTQRLEIRDKRLEIRDKEIDKEIEIDKDIEKSTYVAPCKKSGAKSASDKADCCTPAEMQRVAEAWNELGLQHIVKLSAATNRGRMLNARVKEYGLDAVLDAIRSIKDCPFLMGQNKTGWMPDFAWVIKPNNFIKVLEGNYCDRNAGAKNQPQNSAPALSETDKKDLVEYPFGSGRMIPRKLADKEIAVYELIEYPPGSQQFMPPWDAEALKRKEKK